MADTLLNIFVFAFIGVMIWLYLKEDPEKEEDNQDQKPGSEESSS